MLKPRYDLVDVEGFVDDKFEYSRGVLEEFGDNFGLEADVFVPMLPPWILGCGVRQFW